MVTVPVICSKNRTYYGTNSVVEPEQQGSALFLAGARKKERNVFFSITRRAYEVSLYLFPYTVIEKLVFLKTDLLSNLILDDDVT